MKRDINLWIKKDRTKQRQRIYQVGVLVMSLILLTLFFYYGIFQLLEEVQNKQKFVSTYEDLTGSIEAEKLQIENIKKENQKWAEKVKSFKILQDKGLSWSTLYQNLEQSTPDGITLYDMNFDGMNLALTGFYKEDEEVARYVDRLQTIKTFTKVSLQKLTISPENDRKVFNIVCQFPIVDKK